MCALLEQLGQVRPRQVCVWTVSVMVIRRLVCQTEGGFRQEWITCLKLRTKRSPSRQTGS